MDPVYDLIPLVSFIILGGKCRHCKAKIYRSIQSLKH
ncbi:MAG: prepilin peptidase [Lachnospira pectinoschiza]